MLKNQNSAYPFSEIFFNVMGEGEKEIDLHINVFSFSKLTNGLLGWLSGKELAC